MTEVTFFADDEAIFLSTCVTANWTRRPVAEGRHDAVLLTGQLTRSHRVGARAVGTPEQQKQAHGNSCGWNSLHFIQNTTARSGMGRSE